MAKERVCHRITANKTDSHITSRRMRSKRSWSAKQALCGLPSSSSVLVLFQKLADKQPRDSSMRQLGLPGILQPLVLHNIVPLLVTVHLLETKADLWIGSFSCNQVSSNPYQRKTQLNKGPHLSYSPCNTNVKGLQSVESATTRFGEVPLAILV